MVRRSGVQSGRGVSELSTRHSGQQLSRLLVIVSAFVALNCSSSNDDTPDDTSEGETKKASETPASRAKPPGETASGESPPKSSDSAPPSASQKPSDAAQPPSDSSKPDAAPSATPKPADTPSMAGSAGSMSAPPKMDPPAAAKPEMLDPKVDWKALKLHYPIVYSAFDGVHKFQVPLQVEQATVELSGWSAIPSDAVQFDSDPDNKGVMVTVLKYVPEVTIAARTNGSTPLGGTAILHITQATPADWNLGEQRYTTGADFQLIKEESLPPELKGMDVTKLTVEKLLEILGPVKFAALVAELPARIQNAEPPPSNLKCTNCHSLGAKYFEVQHTPTQLAQVSDEALVKIFTEGMKPPGLPYRVLPADLQSIYPEMHRWMATPEETKGLIVYLRALTPKGQGDILNPDGSYSPPMPDKDINSIIASLLPGA